MSTMSVKEEKFRHTGMIHAPTEPLFTCSEGDEVCTHACRAHDHKIHWSNTTFLENDEPMEEAMEKAIAAIFDAYKKKNPNLASLSPGAQQLALNELTGPLATAVFEVLRDYGFFEDPEAVSDEDNDGLDSSSGSTEYDS